jgi:hypothetical protein
VRRSLRQNNGNVRLSHLAEDIANFRDPMGMLTTLEIQFNFVGTLLAEALREIKGIDSSDRYCVPLKQGADTDSIFMVTGCAKGISGVVSQETD